MKKDVRQQEAEAKEEIGRRQGEQLITALEKAGITKRLGSLIVEKEEYARSIVHLLSSGSPKIFTMDDESLRKVYWHCFTGIKSPEEQVDILSKAFKELADIQLKPGNVLEMAGRMFPYYPKPAGPEGILIVPKLSFVIKWGTGDYCLGSKRVQRVVESTLDFLQWNVEPQDNFNEKRVRLNEKTEKSLKKVDLEFSGDLVAIPFQFGALHRSCPNYVVDMRLQWDEFKLPTYAGACALITHPNRLQMKGCISRDSLHLGCSGDEFSSKGDGNFDGYCFYYIGPERGYDANLGVRMDEVDKYLPKFAPMTGWC
ncbi:MAG: hypothetical protein WC120_04150 [Parcubacteria group bacterium]